MNRIINALKLGVWAYSNPKTFINSNFKMLNDILLMILKVSSERKHLMTHIAFIHPESGEEKEIVSIWAGAGIDADPLKRIDELLKENTTLKRHLANQVKIEL